jgi:hypothetical protein
MIKKDFVNDWFYSNISNPYPDLRMKLEMVRKTNLTMNQLEN